MVFNTLRHITVFFDFFALQAAYTAARASEAYKLFIKSDENIF